MPLKSNLKTPPPIIVTHCVVGAGFQGLPIVKKLREMGEDVVCLDSNSDVGGIWHTGAYETAHIISSRTSTGFPDFPMPESYPDFPSKAEMQRYFRSYADHFGLMPFISLGSAVTRIKPADSATGCRWQIACDNGQVVLAQTVTIANGHHSEPVIAAYPGQWTGETMRSNQYRTPDVFDGKRVLVIGSGNTACDAAVDASLYGASADISVRHGVYFFPRTFMGKPLDILMQGLPFSALWLERLVGWVVHKAAVGDPARYGLPRPSFRIFDRHPVINSELLRRIKLGEVGVRPEIGSYDGRTVTFSDGTSREYDMLFWATGYRITYPMLKPEDGLLDWDGDLPVVWLQLAAPKARGLFIAGLGQARTGGGPLFELGGYLVARMMAFDARDKDGIIAAVENHPRIRLAKRWFGLKTSEKADTRSRGFYEHLRGGQQLARLLDDLGAPDRTSGKGRSTAPSNLQLGAENLKADPA
ncbi:flavin-containing monooxygenase [Tabrizicola sp.]|uniref:flavin-containing monooxygenase n=1 Tax=Tabrizicola sp. TaxID=2005166 RepID=UPI003F31F547